MAFLTIETRGVGDAIKKLAVIAKRLHEPKARQVFLDAAGIIQRRAVELAPTRTRTFLEGGFESTRFSRRLQKAILTRPLPLNAARPTGAVVFVNYSTKRGPTAPHAHFIESGVRPHQIRPREKAMLKFSVGGRMVFSRGVRHPGATAKPFFRPAVRGRSSDARRHILEGLTKVIEEAAR